MAQRRMFNPEIVESDAFLEMPISTQALYFHLGMYADDDGFVSPKKIMRIINSGDDDLKVLKTKRFVLPFESGVVVIKHWLIHNLIRADMYKETLYKIEKAKLGLNDNGAYTELREGVGELRKIEAPKWLKERRKEDLCTVNVPQTVPRLGKDSIGKDREEGSAASAAPTPREEFLEFLKSREPEIQRLITERGEGSDVFIRREVANFIGHWTERTAGGKKQRWELERTFELGRRLATWLRNAEKWQKDEAPQEVIKF